MYARTWVCLAFVVTVTLATLGCEQGSPGSAETKPIATKVYTVRGMHCEACTRSITAALKKLPGVKSVDVSLERQEATVVPSPEGVDDSVVLAAVTALGYEAAAADKVNAPMRPSKRGLLVNITRGKDQLHAVSMAMALAQKALDDGRASAVFFNVEAPIFAAKSLGDDQFADFPSVKQMVATFMSKGGQVFVCQHCAHVVGLKDEDILDGAKLAKQNELFGFVDEGVAVFSY